MAVIAGLALPLWFWLSGWLGWPGWLGGLVLVLLPLRALSRAGWRARALGVCAALLGVAALATRSALPLQYYPVLVNAVLFAVFAASLTQSQSAIEKLARLRQPDLPVEAVAYTRKVTIVWCGFFVLNGAIALWTTTQGERVWALYNGAIAYALIGALFAGEWLVRRRVMQSHA